MDPKDKKNEQLDKGVMRRLFPFNPKKDVQVDDKKDLRLWQTYGNDGYDGETIDDPDDVRHVREGLSEINPNAKKRGLNKLMSMTQTRINPETKEREFLLHRGMFNDEYKNSINENSIISSNKTSWMPDLESAHKYKNSNYATSGRFPRQGHGKVVSAWIKESDIHHIPKMYGAVGEEAQGHNEYQEENEVIVKPHKSVLFESAKKIKKPQKLAASEKLDKDQGRITFNKLKTFTRPDQEVKELTTPRQFEIAARSFANKKSRGENPLKGFTDVKALQDSMESGIGGTVISNKGKFSTPFINTNLEFKDKSVNPAFIKEHEGFHHLMNQVRDKYGHENAGNILNTLISHIHPEDIQNIENSLKQNGYKKIKGDPISEQTWNEEIINRVRDFVHFSGARKHFPKETHNRIKSAWRKMLNASKNVNVLPNNQNPEKLAASESFETISVNIERLRKVKPKKTKNIRRFYLSKQKNIDGVLQKSVIAVGVQFPNGKCITNLLTDIPSINFYNSINDIKDIYGHGDDTEINFMDDLNKSERQKKLEKGYQKFRAKTKYLRKHPENKLPFMFLNSRIK